MTETPDETPVEQGAPNPYLDDEQLVQDDEATQ